MRKLLITGASGFLGWSLCQEGQRQGWAMYGTSQTRSPAIPGVSRVAIDLTDFVAIQQLFARLQPDVVIHAAAMAQPNACQMQPERSHQINVVATENLAGLSADAGLPFLFVSSEQVFDGLNAPYRETDPVCPLNLYGQQKAIAEQATFDRHPQAIVTRMPLMFGVTPHAPSFLQPFISDLRVGKPLNLFTDEIRTPVSSKTAAQGIFLALHHSMTNSMATRSSSLLHLGGKERISRYDFGLLLVEQLGLSHDLIRPYRQADIPMAAPRAPDLSMDSSIAFNLGYQPRSIREELESVMRD